MFSGYVMGSLYKVKSGQKQFCEQSAIVVVLGYIFVYEFMKKNIPVFEDFLV